MISILIDTLVVFVMFIGAFLIVAAMEVYRPMGEQAPLKVRLQGLSFMAVQTFAYSIVAFLIVTVMREMDYRPKPLFDVVTLTGALISSIIMLFVYDFFYYWLHRIQHAVPILWRFHAVHHSVRHLSVPNGYGHFTEQIFRALIIFGPVSHLIVWESAIAVAVLSVVQGAYIHSSTSIRLGPLSAIFVDPRTHHIHHSLEAQHFDMNFGTFSLIWDRVFGTYFKPRGEEWPAVGVEGELPPQGMRDFLSRPFLPTHPRRETSASRQMS